MAKAAALQQRLLQAARNGDKDTTLRLLTEDGVNVNCKDTFGYSPLMWASYYNRVEVTEILLYYSANLNTKNLGGHTPIHVAVSKGSIGCVNILCKAGANLSVRANNGYTPLHEGSCGGKVDCMRVLLEYKVPVNIKSNEGYTPLHLAASKGNLDICQLLLDGGAAIEFTDSAGRTALHLAASCPHGKPVVDLLLLRGANAAKKCLNNKTPAQYAMEYNCTVSIPTLQLAERALGEMENSVISRRPSEPGESPFKPLYPALGNGPSSNHLSTTNLNLSPQYNNDTDVFMPTQLLTHINPHSQPPLFVPPNNVPDNSEKLKELEKDLENKNKLVEQLRLEKASVEISYAQELVKLAQDMKNAEDELKTTKTELETAKTAKTELEATRKKFDLLAAELRTLTARHARLCEHVAEMEESRLCKVCFEKPIGTVLSPCSHCCLCKECTVMVEKKNKKCPVSFMYFTQICSLIEVDLPHKY